MIKRGNLVFEAMREKAGRYIHHDMGKYTLRESDGSVIDEVDDIHVDDLMDHGRVKNDPNIKNKIVLA
jgi:hypothetical protein